MLGQVMPVFARLGLVRSGYVMLVQVMAC